MTQLLPTPTEYAHIRELAEMHVSEAEKQTNKKLAVTLDFPSPDDGWAFRIHVYEKGVNPDERRHWVHVGTKREMEQALGEQQ